MVNTLIRTKQESGTNLGMNLKNKARRKGYKLQISNNLQKTNGG
jgi:hypothetical protein